MVFVWAMALALALEPAPSSACRHLLPVLTGRRAGGAGIAVKTKQDETKQGKTKPAPFDAGLELELKLERWIAYFEADDGCDELARIWRHSFSRRSSTWAGIGADEVADTAGALVWEAVFVCMSILLALEVCASNVLVSGRFHSVKSL
ncbi:hypothetical protein [Rhizobium sp. 18065]|uniref:hypothetical protein n=1 Tax=Rhizobium sp. 18065 TaxID=2681411 RepID=UPI00135A4D39|nr:hypothetical protein [Rhizobium sp. 18065]